MQSAESSVYQLQTPTNEIWEEIHGQRLIHDLDETQIADCKGLLLVDGDGTKLTPRGYPPGEIALCDSNGSTRLNWFANDEGIFADIVDPQGKAVFGCRIHCNRHRW